MEQEPTTYVGIDVAKAQVDVAVRPTDQLWSISYDESGIQGLVSRLKALQPAMVLLKRRVAWNCLWWQHWQLRRCP